MAEVLRLAAREGRQREALARYAAVSAQQFCS
jgi:hypothetical protein